MASGTALERFHNLYSLVNDCWEWKSKANRYGKLKINGKQVAAHRFSYLTFKGEIPKGLNVCHKCDNTHCVNPNHLFVGTQKDNHDDMVNKGRRASFAGEKNPKAKLTKEAAAEIKLSSGSYRNIAKKYCVSHATVYQIKKERIWNVLYS